MKVVSAEQTYRAFEISGPGESKIVLRPVRKPRKTQVRLRVLACGICHGDFELYRGTGPVCAYPRVPGQEIVGLIESLGPDVIGWRVGQCVGCGSFGGSCGVCPACRRGDAIHCEHLIELGTGVDGGLAETIVVEAAALVLLPSEPSAVQLAPLLGAGVAAFQALRSGIARAGEIVAIQGLGRVGVLALQFARRLGFQTVAISRGPANAQTALKCGAHAYIDSKAQNATEVLYSVGGAQAIVSTVPIPYEFSGLLGGLADRGTLVILQKNSTAPLTFPIDALSRGSRSLRALRFGTPWDIEETIRFALANKVTSLSDAVAFEELPELFDREALNPSHLRFVTEPNQLNQ